MHIHRDRGPSDPYRNDVALDHMAKPLVQTKVRWSVWSVMALVLIVIIALGVETRHSISIIPFRIAFWGVLIASVVIVRGIRYMLADDAIVISSPFGKNAVVPYLDVVRIVDTDRERIGRYNLSNKAIRIYFTRGSSCSIVISPVHKDLFLAALEVRCPDAESETEI